MNYIKHLTGFFERVTQDKTLNPTHVSLYMSLFQFWNCNRFKNPISISRDEVMRISKISSKATYHKCLKALHAQGYIKYEPSYNPFKGSHVYLFNFSDDLKPLPKSTSTNFKPIDEQVAGKLQTGTETSPEQVTEQVVVPYINNTNNTNDVNNSNSLNLGELEKKMEEEQFIFKSETNNPKEKNSAQKEKVQIPKLEEVLQFFQLQGYPELEANKFFNYFKSIGWLVGGKTPMADWQAAAKNWMLNAEKFKGTAIKHQHLSTNSDKNYAEPL
ncbi:MAG TPA: transcriptional regulator, partial [Flavobacterium sp.]|uniref:transcriptional regulator n=1 Tax=Flavobacterium sp. TaxID=239 RepID=UPI002C16182E